MYGHKGEENAMLSCEFHFVVGDFWPHWKMVVRMKSPSNIGMTHEIDMLSYSNRNDDPMYTV